MRLKSLISIEKSTFLDYEVTDSGALFGKFLTTEDGKYLVAKFKSKYPNVDITEVKMVDLVLWQIRE